MNHQRDFMVQLIPVETDSFVLPRMLTFSEMKSRETSNPIDPVTKEIKTVTLGIFHNMPLGSRMKWRMESMSGLVPSKTLSSI